MQNEWAKPDQKLESLFLKHGGLLPRKQVEAAGLDPYILTRWVRHGLAERQQRGIYRLISADTQNNESLVEVQLRIPYGVACLSTALSFHGLTTFIPKKIQIAVPQKIKPPKFAYPPIEVFYFSEKCHSFGIEDHKVNGHHIKIYSPEKTLADLMHFRSRTGEDLFTEGLRNYLKRKNPKPNVSKLLEVAKIRRVEKRILPLLEVLLHKPII